MTKSPEAFRTISEVADVLDVPPHVLRFWETRFTQVKPVKRGGGRRYYRPEDVRLLRGIRGLLYDDGMTIKGVQKILRERGIRHVIGLGTVNGHAEEEDAAVEPAAAPARPIELPVEAAPVETAGAEESNGHPYPDTPVAPELFDLHDGVALTERPPRAEVLPDEEASPVGGEAVVVPAEAAEGEGSEMSVDQDVRPGSEAPAAPLDPAERRLALVALVAQLKALRAVMARDS